MIGRIFDFFGLIGVLSILGWTAAIALAGWYAWRGYRNRGSGEQGNEPRPSGSGTARPLNSHLLQLALGLAVAGWMLAGLNSARIKAIVVDDSAIVAEAAARQRKILEEERQALRSRAADIQFAEDHPDDSLDLAGATGPQARSIYEQAAAGEEDLDTPLYRQRGRQQRAAGKKIQREDDDSLSAQVEQEQEQDAGVRKLPVEELQRADRYDRVNRAGAQLALWGCLFLLLADYLWRFNRSFVRLLPLPIAGRWLDPLSPKTHSVLLGPGQEALIHWYLRQAVRKGESFVYFTGGEGWTGDALPRLDLGRCQWWKAPQVELSAGSDAELEELALESAWFGRGCAVVRDEQAAQRVWNRLLRLLERRQGTRAAARRTVHLVWDHPPFGSVDWAAWINLCRETNYKLVVAGWSEQESRIAGEQLKEVPSTASTPALLPAAEFEEVHLQPITVPAESWWMTRLVNPTASFTVMVLLPQLKVWGQRWAVVAARVGRQLLQQGQAQARALTLWWQRKREQRAKRAPARTAAAAVQRTITDSDQAAAAIAALAQQAPQPAPPPPSTDESVPVAHKRQAPPADQKVTIACPHCHSHLGVKPQWAGRQITCPECGQALTVPKIQN